jgi:hypothetical protein
MLKVGGTDAMYLRCRLCTSTTGLQTRLLYSSGASCTYHDVVQVFETVVPNNGADEGAFPGKFFLERGA